MQCKHCGEAIEYMTNCADGFRRWMHVGTTGADDPFGPRPTRYEQCRKAVAEPSDTT